MPRRPPGAGVLLRAAIAADLGFIHDAERLLESIRSRLWEVSEIISREYFTHAQWRLPTQPIDYLP